MTADVRMEARGREQSAAQQAQAATLYLALFLALLAFFLFLNSLTSFDPARTVSVLDSVEAHFAHQRESVTGPQALTPHFAGPSGMRVVADTDFITAAIDAFAPLEAGREDVPLTEGAAWHGVRLPVETLFVGATAALAPAARTALTDVATAMRAGEAEGGDALRRVEMAVGGGDELALRRAVALAAAVTDVAGPEAVAVRTLPGRDVAEFVFYAASMGEAR